MVVSGKSTDTRVSYFYEIPKNYGEIKKALEMWIKRAYLFICAAKTVAYDTRESNITATEKCEEYVYSGILSTATVQNS